MARTADPAPDDGAEHTAEGSVEEGVEHLQAAAHEMLAAARSFLDVVEDVVSDREKLSGVAQSVTELLGSAGGSLARMAERLAGSDEQVDVTTPRPRVRRIDVD
jgi:hypothetical protein